MDTNNVGPGEGRQRHDVAPISPEETEAELMVDADAVAVDAKEDADDIEMGSLPVIELPINSETSSTSLAQRGQLNTTDLCPSSDVDVEAAIVELSSDGVLISAEDLEQSPIAHLVEERQQQQHEQGELDSPDRPDGDSGGGGDSAVNEASPTTLPVVERRAEFLSATIIKAKRNTPIGMELTSKNNSEVVISSITPGSLAAETPFRVGDRILSINNKRCYILDAKDVNQFLAKLEKEVTIVVHNHDGDPNLVESMITKPSPEARCGLGLVSAGRMHLKISNINSDGLFYDSLLNVGDPVVSINGEPCEFCDARDAGDLIARAGKYITVKARTLMETGVVVAAFSSKSSTAGGSTDAPQIIHAFEQVLHPEEPSTKQLAALLFGAVVLIALLLATGLLND